MSAPIRAELGYVAPTVAYPVSATINPEKRSNLNWDWREVAIHDASQIPGDAQLESHGFTCVEHAGAVTEFGGLPDKGGCQSVFGWQSTRVSTAKPISQD